MVPSSRPTVAVGLLASSALLCPGCVLIVLPTTGLWTLNDGPDWVYGAILGCIGIGFVACCVLLALAGSRSARLFGIMALALSVVWLVVGRFVDSMGEWVAYSLGVLGSVLVLSVFIVAVVVGIRELGRARPQSRRN